MATREQLIEGLNKAVDAEDIKSANEIAALLESMDKESEPPPAPPETYVEGVQRRYGESDFSGIAGEFAPEVVRRLGRTQPGQGRDITDVPATVISQGARTGGELIMEAGDVVLPDVVRKYAKQGFEGFMQTGYGRAAAEALSKGVEAYNEWAQENPGLAEEFETTVDVVGVLSPRPDLIDIDAKATATKKKGESVSAAKSREALTGLVRPEKLTTQDRTEKSGLLNTEEWVPNEFEQSLIEALNNTPGIKPYGTVHDNFRVIQDALDAEKSQLDGFIKAQNRTIDIEDLNIEFNDALTMFQEGDVYKLASKAAQKQFDTYAELARDIINTEGADLESVLNARRRFDAAVHAAGQTLDADVATYQAEAAKLVRGVLNDYLKRNTKGDVVHELLDTQFKQLVSLDRMVNKRNAEGKNAISRFKQRLTGGTGVTMPATVLSVLATFGTLADPKLAGGLAAAAGGTIIGQQIRRHGKSAVIQTYAYMLSATDRMIKNTNDPLRLQALELDRQVYASLLEDARSSEETQEDE
jgi:hypothetical protein